MTEPLSREEREARIAWAAKVKAKPRSAEKLEAEEWMRCEATVQAVEAELMTRLEKAEGVLREVADPKCGWIPDAGDGHPSIDMGRAGEIARAYFAEQDS